MVTRKKLGSLPKCCDKAAKCLYLFLWGSKIPLGRLFYDIETKLSTGPVTCGSLGLLILPLTTTKQTINLSFSFSSFILKVYERSYLRIQREEYLQQQLALEKMASEIIFHTISITNALSPDDFFEQVSRPTIQSIFANDPFGNFLFFFNVRSLSVIISRGPSV